MFDLPQQALATTLPDDGWWIALALAGGIAVGAAGVRWLAIRNRWAQPTRRLAETVGRFTGGDWQSRASLDGADDVRRLARHLNALAEHTQLRLTTLADETASLKLLVDALPDPILLSDARERIVLINAPAERLLQVPPQQVIGKPFVAAVNDPAILDLFESCMRDDRLRSLASHAGRSIASSSSCVAASASCSTPTPNQPETAGC